MHIVVALVGHVVVDDVRNRRYIDPTANDIRGHEDVDLVLSQRLEYFVSLRLTHVSMDRLDANLAFRPVDVVTLKLPMQLGRPDLGPAKNDRLRRLLSLEQLKKHLLLSILTDRDEPLLNRLDRDVFIRTVDDDGLEKVAVGKIPNPLVERRAQEHRLSIFRTSTQNTLDARTKSNVEHPVGFVEHHTPDPTEPQRTALDVIDHASRGPDDHLDAVA